jgi:hypothetical protein
LIHQGGGRLALIGRQLAVPNDVPHRVPIVAALHWASDRKPIIELDIYSIVPWRHMTEADQGLAVHEPLCGEQINVTHMSENARKETMKEGLEITAEYLRSILSYDREGVFRWRVSRIRTFGQFVRLV